MKRIILLLILVAPFTFLFMLQYGNPVSMYIIGPIVEKEVIEYLEENGYAREDLKVFKSHYGKPKVSGAYDPRLFVVFKDEPNVAYLYLKLRGGNVVQYCSAETYSETSRSINRASNPQHLEENCYSTRRR